MGGEYRLVGNNCYDFPIKIAQKYFGADLAEIDGWAISPASGLESIQNHNGGFIFDPSQKSLTWVQPEQGDWSQNTSDGPWNADYLWDGRAEVMTEFFPSGDEWTYGRVYADECIELRRENGTGLLFDKNGNLLATVTVGPDGVAYRDVKTGVVEEFMSDGTHRVTAPDGQENAELPADIADLISSTTDSVYAAEIGSRLGSTLGHYLGGDNPFAQVAGSAVLGAFGQNIGQVIDRLGDGQDLSKSIDEAFLGDNNGNGAFSKDLLASVKSAAIGAVSSLLVSELADAVGLDKAGMVGDLINVGLNGATSLIGTNAINMLLETNAQVLANMSLFDGFKDFFNLDGFTGSVAPPAGSPPGTVVPTFAGAVGSFLGGMLASEVMPVTSTEGAIGSALGGAVGSYVGQVVIPIPFLGAFVGSFAGSILGGLLGDLFGGGGHRPTVTSTAMVDFDGTEFHIGATGASGGGDVGVAISMASQAVETLNAVLKLAGGAVINPESLSGLRYGQQDVWYVCGNEDINDPQRGLESSIVRILKDVDFEGADPFVVRAIQRTDAQTVQQLMGEIQIAKDYENYLDNREEINAIIAANPESAFAVGWALTLKEARRLELDKPHPDEFLSRLDKEIAAQDIDLDGRTIHDAVMELKNGVLTIAFRDPANPDQAFADMQPRIVIDDWAAWNKNTSRLQLGDGSAYGLAGMMERFGITDGGGPVALADAMAALAAGTDVDAVWAGGFNNDILVGGDGNDLLDGGAGNDTLLGGAGDDILVGGAGGDSLDGGAGIDTASYAGSAAGVDVDLALGFGTGGDAEHDRLSNVENVTGSAHDDTLAGDDGTNVLIGGAGNDVIEGRGGADTLEGGAGNDTLSYGDSLGGVTVDLSTGAVSGGDAEGDVISGFENVTGGAYDDVLTGDGGVNVLRGGAGADTLTGGAGADTLIGGSGFDTADYGRSTAGVRVDLAAGTGLGGDAEGDRLSGIERVVGSAHDDVLSAGDGAQVLEGGAGNDTLTGGAGSDTLSGGDGADTASYADATAAVSVTLDRGDGASATARGDAAGDVLSGIENVVGGAGADRLAGSAVANTLTGGAGADSLAGGAGDDLLVGGAGNDLIMGGDGVDTAVFAGNAEDYAVETDDQGRAFVRSLLGDDRDILTGVEFIRFDNKLVDVAELRMAEAARRALEESDEDEDERGSNGQRAASTSAEMMARAAMIGLAAAALTHESSAMSLNPLAGEAMTDPAQGPIPVEDAQAVPLGLAVAAGQGNSAPTRSWENASATPSSVSPVTVLTDEAAPSPLANLTGTQSHPDQEPHRPSEEPVAGSPPPTQTPPQDDPLQPVVSVNPLTIDQSVPELLDLVADRPILSLEDVLRLEDELIPLDIQVWSTDVDNSEILTVRIEGVPAGAVLSAGTLVQPGIWTLASGELAGLTMRLPPDLAGEFDLQVFVTSTEFTGAQNTVSQVLHMSVTPQADTPDLTAVAPPRLEDQVVALNIQTQSTDDDGSEVIALRIEGVPPGVSLSAGTEVGPGVWALLPDELPGLTLCLPRDRAEDFTLRVISTSSEASGHSASNEQLVPVIVTAQADTPHLQLTATAATVSSTTADQALALGAAGTLLGGGGKDALTGSSGDDRMEGDGVSGLAEAQLTIAAAPTDGSGREQVFVTIFGVPAGGRLSAGTELSTADGTPPGTWVVSAAQLAGLSVFVPAGPVDHTLYVVATAVDTDPDTGAQHAQPGEPQEITIYASDLGGNDTLDGGAGDDVLLGGVGDDTLTGGAGADQLLGGVGDDLLYVDAADTVVEGGSGVDTVRVQGAVGVVLDLAEAEVEIVYGGAGGDRLLSTGGVSVTMDGGAGDDILLGGSGDDTLRGGVGSDVLDGGSGDDCLIMDGEDNGAFIDGGDGYDRVQVEGNLGVILDLGTAHVEHFTGGAGADQVFNSGSADTTVLAGAGDDVVHSGAGADVLDGGSGSDILSYATSAAGVSVDLATGAASGGSAEGDVISGFENLVGSTHDDRLTGDERGNTLVGGRGSDILAGGGGRDVFRVTVDPSGTRSDVTVIRDFRPSEGDRLSLDGVFRADAVMAMSQAIALQELAPNGDVTLSFPDGSKVVLEGLGQPFTASMTDVAVLHLSAAVVTEGVGTAAIVATLSRPVDFALTLDWRSNAGAAAPGSDYSGSGGQVTIAAAATSASISLQIVGDKTVEAQESLSVQIVGIGDDSGTRAVTLPAVALTILSDQDVDNSVDPSTAGLPLSQTKRVSVVDPIYNFGVFDSNGYHTSHPAVPHAEVAHNYVTIEAGGASNVNVDYGIYIYNNYRYFNTEFRWYYRIDQGYGFGSWVLGAKLPWFGGENVGSYSRSGTQTLNFGQALPEGAVVEVRGSIYIDHYSGGGQYGPGYINFSNVWTDVVQDTEAFNVNDVNADGIADLVYYDYLRKTNVIRLGDGLGGGVDGAQVVNDIGSEGFAFVAGSDFNGDGKSDIAMAEGSRVVLLSGIDAATGTFSASTLPNLVVPDVVMGLHAANFNADSWGDLLVANGSNGMLTSLSLVWGGAGGLAAGTLSQMQASQAMQVSLAAGTWDQVVSLGDVDADGIDDFGLSRNGKVDIIGSSDIPFSDIAHFDRLSLGGSGTDTLTGSNGRDWMKGGAGADTLSGGGGDDVLNGGAGNDVLSGGAGSDTYSFGRGDGQDVIRNAAVDEAAEDDVLRLGAGIRREDLWLERIGDDLRLSVLGGSDSVTVDDWFASPAARLDAIETADGDRLSDDMVSDLVQAMAFHAKPAEAFASVPETPADLLAALDLAWEEP